MNKAYRIVAEFTSPASEGRPYPIFGRVVEEPGEKGNPTWYVGQLSHWCKQSELAGDIYRAPSICEPTVESAESLVRRFLEEFDPTHGFEVNTDYLPGLAVPVED
ncbi:MAG: hypothetical protein U1G08_02560 [Verrucomicrobiota bacterium]